MNRLKQTLKKCVAFGVTGIMLILAGCKSPAGLRLMIMKNTMREWKKREQLHSGLTRRL